MPLLNNRGERLTEKDIAVITEMMRGSLENHIAYLKKKSESYTNDDPTFYPPL